MQQVSETTGRKKLAWGFWVSLLAHLVLVALFLLHLPDPTPPPAPDDSIAVELVPPPPQPVEKPKADAKKAPPAEAKQPRQPVVVKPPEPQAFESAAPDGEDKPVADTPPAEAAKSEPVADSSQPSPQQQAEADKTPVQEAEKSPEGLLAPSEKAAQPVPVPVPREEKPPEGTAETVKPLKEAKKLLSENTLSDPRVRQALGKLPPNRRIVQICSIEALEQVRHARPDAFPDLLVPFATKGGLISDHVLDASGGAFRSQGNWFAVDFRCEVDADTVKLVSFRFSIGAAIPKVEWSARKLPAG